MILDNQDKEMILIRLQNYEKNNYREHHNYNFIGPRLMHMMRIIPRLELVNELLKKAKNSQDDNFLKAIDTYERVNFIIEQTKINDEISKVIAGSKEDFYVQQILEQLAMITKNVEKILSRTGNDNLSLDKGETRKTGK